MNTPAAMATLHLGSIYMNRQIISPQFYYQPHQGKMQDLPVAIPVDIAGDHCLKNIWGGIVAWAKRTYSPLRGTGIAHRYYMDSSVPAIPLTRYNFVFIDSDTDAYKEPLFTKKEPPRQVCILQ